MMTIGILGNNPVDDPRAISLYGAMRTSTISSGKGFADHGSRYFEADFKDAQPIGRESKKRPGFRTRPS